MNIENWELSIGQISRPGIASQSPLSSQSFLRSLKRMKRGFLLFFWIIVAGMPASAQEKLYPVRRTGDVPAVLTSDRSSFVAERSFEFKLTLGYPNDDKAWFLPSTRTRIVALWLRIQNVSQHALELNPTKFTSTDDQGKVYNALTPEEAFSRIMAGAGDTPVVSKTLRGISLGRVANKAPEEQVKEDILRYALQTSSMPQGDVSEGLIFFEAPAQKKFTVSIKLGDMLSKPFVFSTSKQ